MSCNLLAAVHIHLVVLRSPGCMLDTGPIDHVVLLKEAEGRTAALRSRRADRSLESRNHRLAAHVVDRLEEVEGIGCIRPAVAVRIDCAAWAVDLEDESHIQIAAHSPVGLVGGRLRFEDHSHQMGLLECLADVADRPVDYTLHSARRTQELECDSANESASASRAPDTLLVELDLGRDRRLMRSENIRTGFDRFHEACCVRPRNCQP